MMLITADIGNTQSVFGLWSSDRLVDTIRVSTVTERTQDELRLLMEPLLKTNTQEPEVNAIYSSVVPSIDERLEGALRMLNSKKILKLHYGLELPFKFDYPIPESLGTDRIANSTAGVLLYGDDIIIVDFGTAITFCIIISRVYLGGLIAPGLQVGLEYLASKTAQLPELFFPKSFFKKDFDIIGKSTSESMLAGTFYGWEGMIHNIILKCKQKILKMKWIDPIKKLQVIATGGITNMSSLDETVFDIVDKNLTLRGLHQIFKLNR